MCVAVTQEEQVLLLREFPASLLNHLTVLILTLSPDVNVLVGLPIPTQFRVDLMTAVLEREIMLDVVILDEEPLTLKRITIDFKLLEDEGILEHESFL